MTNDGYDPHGTNEDVVQDHSEECISLRGEVDYRSLVENSVVGVYIIDDDRFAYVNPQYARMIGYSEEELLHHVRVSDTVAPEDKETVARRLRQRISGEALSAHYTLRAVRKDGLPIDLEVYGTRAVLHGKPVIQGTVIDVTDQRRAERALAESEAKFRILAESAEAAIGIIQGRHFAYVNPYLERASGYSYDELMQIDVADLVHPDDRQMVMDRLRGRLAGDTLVRHYEYRMVTKDRRVRWLEISPARIVYRGQPAIVGIAYDVTERKEAAEALKRSEEKYRELVEDIADWVWAVDEEVRYTYCSPAVERILGYRPEEIIGRSPFDLLVPEDRERIRQTVEQAVSKREDITNLLNRNLRKDGEVRYLETSGRPIISEQGQLAGYRGVDRDVTEAVISAQAVRRSEARFRAIFEDAPAAIMIADPQGIILRVNSAFEQLTGRPKDDMVGRSVYETVTNPDEVAQARDATERIVQGQPAQNIIWSPLRPDGRKVYIHTNIVPLWNHEGKVEAILSLGTDITDRMIAEEHERELEDQKREFYRRTIMAATEGKLVITEADKICEECGRCLGVWKLESSEQLHDIREQVAEQAELAGMGSDRIYDFVLCAGEALTNAVKHAHGGGASLHRSDDNLCFVVSDHGPGIEALALPEVALTRGYSTAVSLGMGYKTMISIANRVYLSTGPEGTTVGIEMSLQPSEEEFAAAGLPHAWSTKF